MIKEKHIAPIALTAIMLVIVMLVTVLASAPAASGSLAKRTQPDYVGKVFNKDKVTEIEITIEEENWNRLLENASTEQYVDCNVTINGQTFNRVGLRAKGNSSLNMVARDSTTDRYSFKIDFSQYIKGQSGYGLDKLALNNVMSDATYMKEYLSYEMFARMGIATPAYAYTHLTVNGEEWGLYLGVEVMEESFVDRYYGTADGNLYKPESAEMGGGAQLLNPGQNNNKNENQAGIKAADANGQQRRFGGGGGSGGTNLVYNGDDPSNYTNVLSSAILKTTDESDYQKVIDMIKNLNQGTDLEKYLDVDEVLRYLAVNTFLVNLDSYAGSLKHNYYLYEEKGVFQILPWDFNLSFGGHQVSSADRAINFPIDTPVSDTMENSPLISKLLEVDAYKALYHDYLNQIVTEYLESGAFESTIYQVNSLIGSYVQKDATAFYSYEEYENALPVLLHFGQDRAKSIAAQLAGEQPSTTYGTLATTVDLTKLGSMGNGNKGGFGGMPGQNPGGRNDPGNVGMGQAPANGQMPADGQFPNKGAMQDPEVMRQAMDIMREAGDGELTEEQLTKLKELGLDENAIERFKSFSQGGGMGRPDNNQGGKQPDFNGQMPPGAGNQMGQGAENAFPSTISGIDLKVIGISALILVLGLAFVLKFQRRKYVRV